MSQRKYALDILQDSGLMGPSPDKFPMEQNLKLTPTDGALLNDPTKYKRLIGRLIYLEYWPIHARTSKASLGCINMNSQVCERCF